MPFPSEQAFARARRVMPGGVSSPVRAFRAVGGTPRFIASAEGARIRDIDGNVYIDFVSSFGPMILGHAHPRVLEAVTEAARSGLSFGAPTERESELAEKVVAAFGSIEKVRFVSSGTEAAMSAIRLARAATGRDVLIKFEGCYHGHADSLLVQAGSGAATFGHPTTPGIPEGCARLTHVVPYNDSDAVQRAFDHSPGQVAAVIVEPVAANMGLIPPAEGFLQDLRAITRKEGALLIFDEVVTGFRLARGGAQERYGVAADLTLLGKVLGGGLPVGAYGGPADLMDQLAPDGPVYQAGTLAGNPVAVAAGLATLEELEGKGIYAELEAKGSRLARGLERALEATGTPGRVHQVGSLVGLFFSPQAVRNYHEAAAADEERFRRFFHGMLDRGVYLPPSRFETWFVSDAHTLRDLEDTLDAARLVLESLSG